MILLFSIVCLLNMPLISDIEIDKDFSGVYEYSLNTPDGKVEGAMELVKDGEAYIGTITAFGQKHEMKNMVWDEHQLTFEVNAGGYYSKVIGEFNDSTYEGMVHVEGLQIPIKASKK